MDKSKILILILPSASGTKIKYAKLIDNLTSLGNVIFIDNGYFGLGKNDFNDFADLSLLEFYNRLEKIVEKQKFQKIIIVAGSVGAIHGIHFAINSKNKNRIDSLILGSPSIAKNNCLSYLVKICFLNTLLFVNPKALSYLIIFFGKVFPKNKIFHDMKNVEKTIGSTAYLLCLKEIIKYSFWNKKKIGKILKEKAYILAGRHDKMFEKLCDLNLCQENKSFEYVETGHSVLIDAPEKIGEILRKRICEINSNL